MIKIIPPCLAIIGIAVIESMAIAHGINGYALAGAFVAIGGLGGWTGKTVKDHIKDRKNGK